MNNKYKVNIGIEIHIAINTKTKMFSPALNQYNAFPNTNVHPIDLGYPGTLPRPNKKVVIKAIKLAKALNMKIANFLSFDRKNYFYPDLPKGYQITQFFNPIGINGHLNINDKKIIVNQIQIEEDTAKSFHIGDETLLDYNRAGVPLIEIVSSPNIENSSDAIFYIEEIKNIAKFLNISEAKMEKGSMRVDVNLSIREANDKKLGTKVEIKNMNSLSNIKKAIDIEIEEQIKALENNQAIIQSTKRFDEKNNTTKVMRIKKEAIDYKFFSEPNIPKIKLDTKMIDAIIIPKMPYEIRNDYQKQNISHEYIKQIINDQEKFDFINQIENHNLIEVIKLFFSEIVPLAKSKGISIKKLNICPNEFKKAILKLKQGKISRIHFKKIITLLVDSKNTVDSIIDKYNFSLISDEKILEAIVKKILLANNNFVTQNQNNLQKVSKMILGKIMKETKGQANPIILSKIVKKALNM